ncbi:MAG: integration host factor subunit beta [Spirochaetales bacterium]|nr:integration host factor subunit beta [Spirochaetales bacterium]
MKVTKAELIDALHERSDVSRKEIHALIDGLFEEIKSSILGGKTVELRGFGTFEVRIRKGRKRARNPKTGEPVSVEDHGVAAFRPGRDLKKAAWNLKAVPERTDGESD